MLEKIISKLLNKTTASIVSLATVFTMALTKPVTAHEVNVHQWITEQAVEYICKKAEYKKICDEVVQFLPVLREGVIDEDSIMTDANKLKKPNEYNSDCNKQGDTSARFFKHFLRPIDGKGYFNSSGLSSHQFPNAMEWGIDHSSNVCDLKDAQRIYSTDKKRAYYALAHVLHLLQDVTLPEHTHLEAHAFVTLGGFVIVNQFGFEQYSNITLTKTKTLPIPSTELPFKIRSIKDYFKLGSSIAYTINRFSANLNNEGQIKNGNGLARNDTRLTKLDILGKINNNNNNNNKRQTSKGIELGMLLKMFPTLHYQDNTVDLINIGWRIDGNNWKHGANPYFEGMWRGSYTQNDDWWQTKSFSSPPNTKEKKGWYYIESSMQAYPELFKIGWAERFMKLNSASEIDSFFRRVISKDKESYYSKVPIYPNKKSLAELLADELIPLAIQNTAGAIIWYWEQARKDYEIIVNVKGSYNWVSFFLSQKYNQNKPFQMVLSEKPIFADILGDSELEIITLNDISADWNYKKTMKVETITGKIIFNDNVDYCNYSLANLTADDNLEIFGDCTIIGDAFDESYFLVLKFFSNSPVKIFNEENPKEIYGYINKDIQLPKIERNNSNYNSSFDIIYLGIDQDYKLLNNSSKLGEPIVRKTSVYNEKTHKYQFVNKDLIGIIAPGNYRD